MRPDLKLGTCGEHGGDPDSVRFFHQVGLDYVSCSPYDVPVARLAAARAAMEERARKGVPDKRAEIAGSAPRELPNRVLDPPARRVVAGGRAAEVGPRSN